MTQSTWNKLLFVSQMPPEANLTLLFSKNLLEGYSPQTILAFVTLNLSDATRSELSTLLFKNLLEGHSPQTILAFVTLYLSDGATRSELSTLLFKKSPGGACYQTSLTCGTLCVSDATRSELSTLLFKNLLGLSVSQMPPEAMNFSTLIFKNPLEPPEHPRMCYSLSFRCHQKRTYHFDFQKSPGGVCPQTPLTCGTLCLSDATRSEL